MAASPEAGSVGQKVTPNSGTSIKWRATLNGTARKRRLSAMCLVVHDQLPDQRLLLRLPVHRFRKQQRDRRHGGLERNTACRDLHHGERRSQDQFLKLRYRGLRCPVLHLAQHHEIHDRPSHYFCVRIMLDAVHRCHLDHDPRLRSIRTRRSNPGSTSMEVRMEALCSIGRAHRTDDRHEPTIRQHPVAETQRCHSTQAQARLTSRLNPRQNRQENCPSPFGDHDTTDDQP